jgi:hypothetical protein
MDSIKFPIKFDRTGLQKLTDGTEDYYAQILTIAMLSEPGILPFSPGFGVNDPTFTGIDKGIFVLNASRFVPEIEITEFESIERPDGTDDVSFTFVIKEVV